MKLGRLIWKMQRYSALYFLFFVGYLEYLFVSGSYSFEFLNNSYFFKSSLSMFVFLAALHGFAGMWAVGTDYLTVRTLGFLSLSLSSKANLIRKIYEILFFALGVFVIIFYFLLIWF